MRDRARAVPMPLPAGTSADRKGYWLKADGGTAGLANALYVSDWGSAMRAARGSGGVSGEGGGAGRMGATRAFWSSGRPIQKSAFKGRAIRSATNRPTLTPATRLITSPASHPHVQG